MVLAELLELRPVNGLPAILGNGTEAGGIALIGWYYAQLKQRTHDVGFIADMDLVGDVEALVKAQVGVVPVLSLAFGEELDAARDVKELVGHSIGFDRHVVSEVPTLKEPG